MGKHSTLMEETKGTGLFQKRLAFVLILTSIPAGLQVVLTVFLVYTPPHRCMLPVDISSHGNVSNETLFNLLPLEEEGTSFSSCEMYRFPDNVGSNKSAASNGSLERIECDDWYYYGKDRPNLFTTSMEFGWICSREWMYPLIQSAQPVGIMVGSIVGGSLSDKLGRKWTYTVSRSLQYFVNLLAAFSPNETFLIIAWGITHACGIIQTMTGIIIANECLNDGLRQLVSMFQLGCYGVGYMLLPLYGYLFPDWRHLTIAVAVTGIVLLPTMYYIVESPRWLALSGRTEEAEEVMKQIARINQVSEEQWGLALKRHYEENNDVEGDSSKEFLLTETNNNDEKKAVIDEEKEQACSEMKKDKKLTILHLFKCRFLLIRFVICVLMWFASNMGYYGLSFSTNDLGGDRYSNCFWAGAVEIPGTILCYFLLRKIGGRIAYVFMTCVATVLFLLVPFLEPVMEALSTASALIGKLFITGSFNLIYAITGEVFPTMIRNQAFGGCNFLARLGTISAPYVFYLGKVSLFIPYLIIGTISACSALAAYNLPETKGRPIPDTYQDAKQQELQRIKMCSCTKTTTSSKSLNVETSSTGKESDQAAV